MAEFPIEASGAVQYGPRIRSLVIYLKDHALLSYARLRELAQALLGVSLSTGTIARMKQESARRLSGTVEQIRTTIQGAEGGHFDETGLRIEGELSCLHSASTSQATYYEVHRRRGREALEAMGILGEFHGVAMHDGWYSYAGYAERHGLCNVTASPAGTDVRVGRIPAAMGA